jgi:hypothetical protein
LRGYPYERSNEIDKDVELYWLDLELEAYRKHLGAKSARLAGAELCVFRNIRGRAQITPLRGFPPFARPIRDAPGSRGAADDQLQLDRFPGNFSSSICAGSRTDLKAHQPSEPAPNGSRCSELRRSQPEAYLAGRRAAFRAR